MCSELCTINHKQAVQNLSREWNSMNDEQNVTTPSAPVLPEQVGAEPVVAPEPIAPPVAVPAPAVPEVAPAATAGPSRQRIIEIALVLAVVVLGAVCGLLYHGRQALQSRVNSLSATNKSLESNPQIVAQKQTADTIKNVSALITLPTGETPTVANVSDAMQARKQSAFFNNAQNDDKVLMYVKAGEAILYRPSTNKIILVAPLTFNSTAAQKS